jgi:archaellum component FlaG (FlaF/FlaG flagellin family)
MKNQTLLSRIGRSALTWSAAIVLTTSFVAHAGDEQKIKNVGGKIVAVDDTSITIKTKEGDKTFSLSAETKITDPEKNKITAADLKPSGRVRITLGDDGQSATSVQVLPAGKKPGTGKPAKPESEEPAE